MGTKYIDGILKVEDSIFEGGVSLASKYAKDSSVVHKGKDETITGNKTFNATNNYNGYNIFNGITNANGEKECITFPTGAILATDKELKLYTHNSYNTFGNSTATYGLTGESGYVYNLSDMVRNGVDQWYIGGSKAWKGVQYYDEKAYFNNDLISKLNFFSDGFIYNNKGMMGGYLDLHPEANTVAFPFYMNDLAYLQKKGGSCTITGFATNDEPTNSRIFNGKSNYSNYTLNSTSDTVTILIKTHTYFSWGSSIGISFGSSNWRAKNIKIELGYATTIGGDPATDAWATVGETTDYPEGNYFIRWVYGPTTSGDGGKKWNTIRFTLTNFNGLNIRIAGIYMFNYSSEGLNTTLLGKDGGEMYGHIYPYKNGGMSLGTADKAFDSVYTGNVRANYIRSNTLSVKNIYPQEEGISGTIGSSTHRFTTTYSQNIDTNYIAPMSGHKTGGIGASDKYWNTIYVSNVRCDNVIENGSLLKNKYLSGFNVRLGRTGTTNANRACSFCTMTFSTTWQGYEFEVLITDKESKGDVARYSISGRSTDSTTKINCSIKQIYTSGSSYQIFAVQSDNVLTFFVKSPYSYRDVNLAISYSDISSNLTHEFAPGTWTEEIPEATFTETNILDLRYVQKVSNTHSYAAQVYGIGNDGTQKMWNVATTTAGYTIPYRLENGQLSVGTPTADEHATTKAYVDTNYIPKKSINNAYQAIVDNSGAAFTVTAGLSNNTGQTKFTIAPSGIATINDKQIVTKDDLSNASVAKIETSDTIFGANDEGYPTIVNKSGNRIIGIGSGDEGLLDNYMYYTFPEKQGTVALMTDIPTKSSWNYDDSYVKYSAAQTLTDAQKTQARSNIGAGTSNFTGYTSSNKLSTDYINNKAGWTSNAGTVTSVRVQATSPIVSSSNTAQTSSLNTTISLADGYGDTKNPYASKTKNWVLAAPNGSAGAPTFRALVAADIPSLPSNKITAMTGYSKASSASAIKATDSLNTAIGKLEKALDGKGTSNLTLGTTATTAAAGDHTHSVATTSANGLMSKEDKTKLDTISNNYVKAYNTGKNSMPGTIINNGSSIYIDSGNDSINVIGEGDEHGVGISVGDNNFVNFYQDRTEMIDAPVKIKQIQAPTASNGSTYGLGTSGHVLKSNGTSVYWASDNNTTYNSHTRGTTGSTSASMVIPAAAARQIHTWWRTSTDLYSKGGSSWAGSVQDVAASALFAMQSWSPTGDTSAHSSNYGTALNNSMNSSNFATNLNAMGTAAWVSPCKGDYVIDPYGCIGVIEEYPLGTAVQTSYPVRLVYKSNARWNYTCVEEGTLITMSDGTYRPVEELDQGDLIMGWDFENDKPIEAVTLFARQTQNLDKMTYMIFDNGEYISFSAEHELYSKTHQKYMFINDLKEGDIVMGKDGEDVEIMSIHRDIWSFGRKNFYQVVSSNNTYFANNILNAMHPINKLNWVQYGLMQEISQEIMEIFVEDCREFDCWQFLVQDKAFLKQAVSIQREMKLRSNRIDELKQYLAKTDYVALKYSEGELVDTTVIEQRQASRLEINKLEDELKNQYQPEYNELLTSHALIGEDILLSDTERQIKYFKLACKRDNENLELFKKHYPVKEKIKIDWENYTAPVIEVVEEESE